MTPLRRIRLTHLNDHLRCTLCKGYYIEATTIIECLHTFCKPCIVGWLQGSSYCPQCDTLVHKTNPMKGIREDKTLQDIVYKIVPGLFRNEISRRVDFYREHPEAVGDRTEKALKERRHFFHVDDQISLSLDFLPPAHAHAHALGLRALRAPSLFLSHPPRKAQSQITDTNGGPDGGNKEGGSANHPDGAGDDDEIHAPVRRYLKCPAAVQIRHLEKFIREKYRLSQEYRVDIVHGGDCLSPELTLLDVVYMYKWTEDDPLRLQYTVIAPTLPLRKRPRVIPNKIKWKVAGPPPKRSKLALESGNDKLSLDSSKKIESSEHSKVEVSNELSNCKKEEKNKESSEENSTEENAEESEAMQCSSLNSSRDDGEDAMVIDESGADSGGHSGDKEVGTVNEESLKKYIPQQGLWDSEMNTLLGNNISSKLSSSGDPIMSQRESTTNSSIESLEALVHNSSYPGYPSKNLLTPSHSSKTGSSVPVSNSCSSSKNGPAFIPKVPNPQTSSQFPVVSAQTNTASQNSVPSENNSQHLSTEQSPSYQSSSSDNTTQHSTLSTIKASDISESIDVFESSSDNKIPPAIVSPVNGLKQSAVVTQSVNSKVTPISPKHSPKPDSPISKPMLSPRQNTKPSQDQEPVSVKKPLPIPISALPTSTNNTLTSTSNNSKSLVSSTSTKALTTPSSTLAAMPKAFATPSPALLTPVTTVTVPSQVSKQNPVPTVASPSPALLTPRPVLNHASPIPNMANSQTAMPSQVSLQRTAVVPNPRLISNPYRPKLAPRVNGAPCTLVDPTKPRLGRPPNASRILAAQAGRMSPHHIQPVGARPSLPQKNSPIVVPKVGPGRGRPKGSTNVEKANRLIAPRGKLTPNGNSLPGPNGNSLPGPNLQQNVQKENGNNLLNAGSSNTVPKVNGHNLTPNASTLERTTFTNLQVPTPNSPSNFQVPTLNNRPNLQASSSNPTPHPNLSNQSSQNVANKQQTVNENKLKTAVKRELSSNNLNITKNIQSANNVNNNKNSNQSSNSNSNGNKNAIQSGNNSNNDSTSQSSGSSNNNNNKNGNQPTVNHVTNSKATMQPISNVVKSPKTASQPNGNITSSMTSKNSGNTPKSLVTPTSKSPKPTTAASISPVTSVAQSPRPQATTPVISKSGKSPGRSKTHGSSTNIHNIAQNLANKQLQQKNQNAHSQEMTDAITSTAMPLQFSGTQYTSAPQFTTAQLSSALGMQVPYGLAAYAYLTEAQKAAAVQNFMLQTMYNSLPNLVQSQLNSSQYEEHKKDSDSQQPMDLSPTNKGAPSSALSNNKQPPYKNPSGKASSSKTNFPKPSQAKSPKTTPSPSSASPKTSTTSSSSQQSNIAPPTSEVTITKLPNVNETSSPVPSSVTVTKSSNTNTVSITKRPSSTPSNVNGAKFGTPRAQSNASVRQIPNPSHLSHQSEVRNNSNGKNVPKTQSPVNNNNNNNNHNNNKMVKVDS